MTILCSVKVELSNSVINHKNKSKSQVGLFIFTKIKKATQLSVTGRALLLAIAKRKMAVM